MTRSAASGLVLVAASALLATAGAGSAQGVVIAEGESPAGVPWKVRGSQRDDYATFAFTFRQPGYSSAGYSSTVPYPFPRRLVFHAVLGRDISPFPEDDVSGIARSDVTKLRLKMRSGKRVNVYPVGASEEVQATHPWTTEVQVFEAFFSAGDAPKVISAYDAEGDLLDRQRQHRFGLFY